jgi:hypothetical protein
MTGHQLALSVLGIGCTTSILLFGLAFWDSRK